MGLPCTAGQVVHCTRTSGKGAAIHSHHDNVDLNICYSFRLMVEKKLSKLHKGAEDSHTQRECRLCSPVTAWTRTCVKGPRASSSVASFLKQRQIGDNLDARSYNGFL